MNPFLVVVSFRLMGNDVAISFFQTLDLLISPAYQVLPFAFIIKIPRRIFNKNPTQMTPKKGIESTTGA
jgi:hypothetical protein